MQDQRIIGTSAPRCVGNTLLLNGRTYSPPYVITAIGDTVNLAARVSAAAAGGEAVMRTVGAITRASRVGNVWVVPGRGSSAGRAGRP